MILTRWVSDATVMYRTNLVFDCSCENATPRSLDGLENDDDFSDFKIDGNDELSRLIPLTSLMAYYLNKR